MPDWKKEIRTRLKKLRVEPAREAEIVQELSQHLEERYRELLAEGTVESEARRMALAELRDSDAMVTGLEQSEGVYREPAVPGSAFTGIRQDLTYAVRTLRRKPAFALFVVATLALGIGANTAVFTIVNTLVLNPLSVRDPKSLLAVETRSGGRTLQLSAPDLRDIRDRNAVFSEVAGYTPIAALTLSGGEKTERIFVEFVTGNYFDTLGLRPALGRFFDVSEEAAGAVPVAVIGYTAWQHRFGGATDIIGRRLTLNSSVEATVIGVAPPGFKGVTALFGPDLWIPAGPAEALMPGGRRTMDDRSAPFFHAAARLKPGITAAQAEANLQTILAALKREYSQLKQDQVLAVRPLSEAAQGDSRQPMVMASAVLMGVVGLILLIACSNAASLFLSRSAARRQELAVRLAMGASRFRLVRQLLTESILLAVVSGVAGLGLGYAGCLLLWSFRPADVALNFVDPKLDAGVAIFAVGLSLLTGILFGLAPALQSSRGRVADALKEEARTSGRSRARVTFRNLLLVGQVAFSLVALVTAALFLRSIQRAYTIDPGFQTANLAVLMTNQGQAGYTRARTEQFYREARTRVAVLPGVAAAAWASNMPLWNRPSRAFVIEGQGQVRKQDAISTIVNTVDRDYFRIVAQDRGAALAGRTFTSADHDSSAPVAVINQTMADRYWPKQNPLGARFQFYGESVWREVVGVVRNANYSGLGEAAQPCVFLPAAQNFVPGMVLYVRTVRGPSGVLASVQRELRAIDPQLDVSDARTGARIVDEALFSARLGVGLLSVFGALGLALASVGLYGIVAYSVSQRRREIGVRVAMGASQSAILKMVVRQGMAVAGGGVLLGLAVSLAAGRGLAGMLYGVSPADPVSLLTASGVLLAVSCAACYFPARAAARIDPLVALRDS